MASFPDDAGKTARRVLENKMLLEMKTVPMDDVKQFLTSWIQIGEASCVLLVTKEPNIIALSMMSLGQCIVYSLFLKYMDLI